MRISDNILSYFDSRQARRIAVQLNFEVVKNTKVQFFGSNVNDEFGLEKLLFVKV